MEEMPHALSQAKAKAALNLSLPLYNLLIKPIDTIFT